MRRGEDGLKEREGGEREGEDDEELE